MEWLPLVGTVIGSVFVILMSVLLVIKAFYIKVDQGWALIINDTTSVPKVKFTGGLVLPVIHKKELMKISLISMDLKRNGKEGLICKDNIRADISVVFYLRVNETAEDVLKVAKAIGVDRASDKEAVNELFNAKFSEALKTVGKQLEFMSLFEDRAAFRDAIIKTIGNDLNGYVLEDVAIDDLEQTPKSDLNPENIMDADGIRKITQLTSKQNMVTNEIERDTELAIEKKDTESREAMLALERQRIQAEESQKREISTIRATEKTAAVQADQEARRTQEQARIDSDQQIEVANENKTREVQVAEQNRERVVSIERERVAEATQLQIVERERSVTLRTINKEREVEVQRAEIANVIRERVDVEKNVARSEEETKDIRAQSEAERARKVDVVAAESKAQVEMVKQVKAAEAAEQSATHKANELKVTAQAQLDASGMQAEARKKLADAEKVEISSKGLAEAQVKEAMATAQEKQAVADARGISENLLAEAKGAEALAKVKEVQAVAEKTHITAVGEATAAATKVQGLAEAEVTTAKAAATEKMGLANANVEFEMLNAPAKALVERFKAIAVLPPEARAHEEFRMGLENDLKIALEQIGADKEVAKANAEVMAAAMSKANIDIVGGDGDYFKNFARALTVGKSIEGLASKSPIVGDVINRVLHGKSAAALPALPVAANGANVQDEVAGILAQAEKAA